MATTCSRVHYYFVCLFFEPPPPPPTHSPKMLFAACCSAHIIQQVKHINQQLLDCREKATLFNQREILFEKVGLAVRVQL